MRASLRQSGRASVGVSKCHCVSVTVSKRQQVPLRVSRCQCVLFSVGAYTSVNSSIVSVPVCVSVSSWCLLRAPCFSSLLTLAPDTGVDATEATAAIKQACELAMRDLQRVREERELQKQRVRTYFSHSNAHIHTKHTR